MPMYRSEDGVKTGTSSNKITAELKVQATSEDSLEHSEVPTLEWG